MEPQLPDLPAEVTGVGLAEILGVLGEQAVEEVHAAEVAVGQYSQDRTSGSISTSYRPAMYPMLYVFAAIAKAARASRARSHISSEDVVGMTAGVLAGSVVAHGGPGIGVPGSDLDIAQVHPAFAGGTVEARTPPDDAVGCRILTGGRTPESQNPRSQRRNR